ncbi:hypothetical protein BHAOGJBA_0750 [Methylobacterium hispanicum]|uniref:Uncharacterized protein n=1 Tax=Methylobacterium hispanicum TaxID=270350 RepID=A0AAV4ZGW7_9HYPH|nr:hypothetical protein [Methylobacterium hispanicum]GJD87250.1 hypothetical protein BHAOGJBA_0750 [Methylobacterium hispanicum]
MSTAAILAVSACTLIGWCVLVQAVREVLVARAQPPACPCRDLTSLTLTPGTVFELSPGTVIPPATEADPRFVSFTQKPKEAVSLHPDLARMARRAGEVQ